MIKITIINWNTILYVFIYIIVFAVVYIIIKINIIRYFFDAIDIYKISVDIYILITYFYVNIIKIAFSKIINIVIYIILCISINSDIIIILILFELFKFLLLE